MCLIRVLLLLSLSCVSTLSTAATPAGCLSEQENILAQLVNTYRASQGLEPVSISKSISSVAQWHTIDLFENNPDSGVDHGLPCNAHSWSDANNLWSPVCYTGDHAYAQGMWSKPAEITGVYTGYGYENVYWHSSAAQAQEAFDGWKNSPPHRETILEQGIWNGSNWQAMGVGIYKNYATLWFGKMTDPAGTIPVCGNSGDSNAENGNPGQTGMPTIIQLLLD